jgi:hypothetical protein
VIFKIEMSRAQLLPLMLNAKLNRILPKLSATLYTRSTPRLINVAGLRIVWMHQG